MTECSKNVLSNCLNPAPLQVGSWKSMAKSAFDSVVDGGKQIILGAVVDTFWNTARGVDNLFKYNLGVDEKLGKGNPWSFSGVFKHYSWSLTGNPVYKVLDSACHLFYGGLNTLTGGGLHVVFNDHLNLGIEYFSPPPQDLRGSANWFTTGVLIGAAPVSAAARSGGSSIAISSAKSTVTPKAAPVSAQPSFAASVSEIGTITELPVPLTIRPEAIRPPRLPEVIPADPVIIVVKPAPLPKAKPAPTELAPPLRHPLPQVFEPHQVTTAASAIEGIESAFWTFLRGTQRTLEILEQEKLPARILAEDKIYHAKLEQGLRSSSKVQEALDRVKQKRLEKEKLSKK